MNFDWQTIYQTVFPFLPAQISADITLIGTFLISLAAVIARFWPRPAEGSKWLPLYLLVNTVAMNGKHAINADDAKP
ncbi:hypothetical protein [Asaia sp. HumB]|uniref:hypothetical protein n=1 Tax=Asaia sp. HumB TaxID=3035475 RepID=UPI00255218D9|nr:hypothetical protein [Asaia sp. HumB]MDL2169762.1 hypothetical protein [Asaia sp. HumB]